jgi:MFS family permease
MANSDGVRRPLRTGLGETLSLLGRNRAFARLYGAQLISFAGDWFTTVAILGLVYQLTGSATLTALALVMQSVPFAIFAPVGGYLADRFDRRKLMIGADLIRASLALGLLLIDRPSEVWLAFVLVGGIAALGAVFEPASSAAVPNLVEPEDLPAANVLTGSAWGAMLAVGGAAGGVVAATLGRDAAFVGDALTFSVSALLLLGIRRPFSRPREDEPRVSLRSALVETARYARRDGRVLSLLAVKAGFGLSVGVIALLPLFALEIFDAGDRGTGILFAFRGLGALIGPFLVRRFTRDLRALFVVIGLSFAVYGGAYAAFPVAGTLLAGALFVFLAHLGGGAQWTLSTYGLQRIVPDRLRGRVFAFDYGLVTLTIALSTAVTGWAADRLDPRTVMLGLASVSLAWSVVWSAATTSIRRRRTFEDGNLTAAPEAPPAPEAERGAGPVAGPAGPPPGSGSP